MSIYSVPELSFYDSLDRICLEIFICKQTDVFRHSPFQSMCDPNLPRLKKNTLDKLVSAEERLCTHFDLSEIDSPDTS